MILVERFWHNLAKGGSSDIDIIIECDGHVVRFPCHKEILKKASCIFKKELSNKTNYMTIKNVDPYVVFLMLCYIYDEAFNPIHWKTTVDVFIAAVSYEVTSLVRWCIKSLLDLLDLSNACSLLELAMAYSIPELYASSLEMCIIGAFHILDSEDFDWVQPSTVIAIVSQPHLNIPNETYILYALWIRATIDTCRNNMELTYNNIVKYFEPYSIFIQYADVDEDELRLYENEYLMQYYQNINITNEHIYPIKRRMKFPLRFPPKFYINYSAGDIISLRSFKGQSSIEFLMKESMYLIEFQISYCFIPNDSRGGIKKVSLENGKAVLLEWESKNINSKLKMKLGKRTVYMSSGDFLFQNFRIIIKDLVKLCFNKTYYLRIESVSELLWPEVNSESAINFHIRMPNSTHQGVTDMKFLPCPVSGNFYQDV